MSKIYDKWLEDADSEDITPTLDSYKDHIERMINECDKQINSYDDRFSDQFDTDLFDLYSDALKNGYYDHIWNYQKRLNKKKNTNTFPIYTKVKGVTFNNRQSIVSKLKPNQILTLIREPENKYDQNAIAVYSEYGRVGYIAKGINEDLAAGIDNGENYKCTVIEVTGSSTTNYGVNIRIEKRQEEIETRNNEKPISVNRKYNIGDTLYHIEYGKLIIEEVIGEIIYTKTEENKEKSFLIGDCLDKHLMSKKEYYEFQNKNRNANSFNTDNYVEINNVDISKREIESNVTQDSEKFNKMLFFIILISFIIYTYQQQSNINDNNLIVEIAQQESKIEKEIENLDIYGKLAERRKHGNFEYISIREEGYKNLIENIDENEGLVGIVSTQGLNFRESNSMDSDVILILHENEKVLIVGESNGWYFGLYESEGKYGWCSKYYITLHHYNINTGELIDRGQSIKQNDINQTTNNIEDNNEDFQIANNENDLVYFSIGSTEDDVIKAMGTPDSIEDHLGYQEVWWSYGDSIVKFNYSGKVKGWEENRTLLNKSMGDAEQNNYFKIGSTEDDVIKAMGTPDSIEDHLGYQEIWWSYGDSIVKFNYSGKVKGWEENRTLLNKSMGDAEQNNYFKIGSTEDDVIKAMGTPDSIEDHLGYQEIWWSYGDSIVKFNYSGKVKGWEENRTLLNKSMGDAEQNNYFKIGSTEDDVIKAMGTPDSIEDHLGYQEIWWSYGDSIVKFNYSGKVKGWEEGNSIYLKTN